MSTSASDEDSGLALHRQLEQLTWGYLIEPAGYLQ
jgi:hypothetical protein